MWIRDICIHIWFYIYDFIYIYIYLNIYRYILCLYVCITHPRPPNAAVIISDITGRKINNKVSPVSIPSAHRSIQPRHDTTLTTGDAKDIIKLCLWNISAPYFIKSATSVNFHQTPTIKVRQNKFWIGVRQLLDVTEPDWCDRVTGDGNDRPGVGDKHPLRPWMAE